MKQNNISLIIFSLIISFLLLPALVMAKSTNEWQVTRKIEVRGDQLYKSFFLDKQVYHYATTALRDLRIINEQKKFIPYFIQKGYSENTIQSESFSAKLVKKFQKKTDFFQDFQLQKNDQTTDIYGNILEFSFPNSDFFKKVAILGSYDGLQWHFIKQDQIYQIKDIQKNTINLDSNYKYEYYRIKQININQAAILFNLKLLYYQNNLSQKAFLKKTTLNYTVSTKNNLTTIEIANPDFLKIKSFLLQAKGDFRRKYRISASSSNAKLNITKPNSHHGHGDIYQFKYKAQTFKNNQITCQTPLSYPKIIITIKNHDNEPLKIEKIQTFYYVDRIIFKANQNQQYHLLYGNNNAQKPIYDIELFKTKIENMGFDLCFLNEKAQFKQLKKSSNFKLIFNLVITFVTIVLVIFLTKQLIKPPQKRNKF